ncbi:hypothetical protein GCM10027040_27340 [Halomonas shantousis]
MKRILIASSLAAALSGCAGLPAGNDRPHYDHDRQAMVAPGYSVEFIPKPKGYKLYEIYGDESRQKYSQPGEYGSAGATFDAVVFVRDNPQAAIVMTFKGAGPDSRWLPFKLDYYEFVGNTKFSYGFESGRFIELSGNDPYFTNSTNCAIAVNIGSNNRDQRKQFVGRYVEEVPCEKITPKPSRRLEESMRRKAYHALNIN